MENSAHFPCRMYYPRSDNRIYIKSWKRINRNRLDGIRIDPDFMRYSYLIRQYTLLHSKLTEPELDCLIYLAHLNRCITADDMYKFPNGFGLRKQKQLLKSYIEKGILEYFEGHSPHNNRKISYRIGSEARRWISDMNAMLLGTKKIPLHPSLSDPDFVTRRSDLKKNKHKPNWYAAINEFNAWVTYKINEQR